MTINNDIKEAKKVWRQSTPIVKVWIAISVLLSVSSIASIADAVIKWKGFILDGINFHENFVITPMQSVLSNTGLQLDSIQINFILVAAISLIGLFKIDTETRKTIVKSIISNIVMLSILKIVLKEKLGLDIFIPAVSGIIVASIITKLLESDKTTKYQSFKFIAPLVFAFFLVLIAGAVYKGFTM
ncbi:hypothetical protein [Thalassotalea montiporae]